MCSLTTECVLLPQAEEAALKAQKEAAQSHRFAASTHHNAGSADAAAVAAKAAVCFYFVFFSKKKGHTHPHIIMQAVLTLPL